MTLLANIHPGEIPLEEFLKPTALSQIPFRARDRRTSPPDQ
jgi:plasmid maintenance system antidote protein VapI